MKNSVVVASLAVVLGAGSAGAQEARRDRVLVRDPADPARAQERADRRKQRLIERELRRINHEYFRAVNNTERRQVGIAKLREHTDPLSFEPMLGVFGSGDAEIREVVLDHLTEQASDQADAALTWAAVYGESEELRNSASYRVATRFDEDPEVSHGQKSIIAAGLAEEGGTPIASAANLASMLKLYEAIPMLINAQVGGGGGATEPAGAPGQIWVAQQQAFVSDLQPVVSDSAVGFDPELSVVTDGVALRVLDAAVVIYRHEVHSSLVSLSSDAWGRSTAHLGFDQQAWREWYVSEFEPHMAKQRMP